MQQIKTHPVAPLHVIVLEDDDLLRDHVLVPSLTQLGFVTSAASHPDQLAAMVARRTPDIVVLDIGLPDRDGFDVSRELRAQHAEVGVVMLTGRSDKFDRVRGLREGADVYLSKPADIDVLAATLHSLARRLHQRTPAAGSGWRMDTSGWCLESPGGESVAVTKAEARLLSALLKKPNEVLARDDLIARLTDNTWDFDPHRLDSIIHRLRRKVRKVLGIPLPLTAVHGEGYVIVQPG